MGTTWTLILWLFAANGAMGVMDTRVKEIPNFRTEAACIAAGEQAAENLPTRAHDVMPLSGAGVSWDCIRIPGKHWRR